MVDSKARRLAAQRKHKARLEKSLLIAADLFVLLLFVAHPLIITADYYNITETKAVFFAICFVVMFAIYIAQFAEERILGYRYEIDFKKMIKAVKPYEWALIAYWVIMLLSAIFSPYPDRAWGRSSSLGRSESMLVQTVYIGTFFLISRVYKPKERDFLIFCAVATAVASYALCQFYGYDFFGLNPQGSEHLMGPRLTFVSTMSNINVASTYFTMAACIAIVYYVQTEGLKRFIYLFFATILIVNIFVYNVESGLVGIVFAGIIAFPYVAKSNKTLTRLFIIIALASAVVWLQGIVYRYMAGVSALHAESFLPASQPFIGLSHYFMYVAVACVVIAVVCRFIPLQRLSVKVWRIGWAILLVACIVIGLSLLPVAAERTQNGLLIEASEALRGELRDEAGSYRGLIWKLSITLVGDRLLLGYGPDVYAAVFTEHFDDIVIEKMGVHVDKAHNEYLQNLVNYGVTGVAAVIAFYALLFWSLRKHYDKTMVVAVATALICFCFQAFFNFSTAIAHPIVWGMWGVMGALATEASKESGKSDAR